MGSMSASDAAPLPRLGEVYFDVRGESRSMRLSWYADTGVAVFSIWQGGTCTGTFRLPIADLPRMVEALQRGPRGREEEGADGQSTARDRSRPGRARRPRPELLDSDVETGQSTAAINLPPLTGGPDDYPDDPLVPGYRDQPAKEGRRRRAAGPGGILPPGYGGEPQAADLGRSIPPGYPDDARGTSYPGEATRPGYPAQPPGAGRDRSIPPGYPDDARGTSYPGEPAAADYASEPLAAFPADPAEHDYRRGMLEPDYPADPPGPGYRADPPRGFPDTPQAAAYPGDPPTAFDDDPLETGYGGGRGGYPAETAGGHYPGEPPGGEYLGGDFPTGPEHPQEQGFPAYPEVPGDPGYGSPARPYVTASPQDEDGPPGDGRGRRRPRARRDPQPSPESFPYGVPPSGREPGGSGPGRSAGPGGREPRQRGRYPGRQ
jgi:hypothetical protein